MSQLLQQAIAEQRVRLVDRLQAPLAHIASECAALWADRDGLERMLASRIVQIPRCRCMFLLDTACIQYTNLVNLSGVSASGAGRDCSMLPYIKRVVPAVDFMLSEAYVSVRGQRPSLTAVQLIRDAGKRALGFLCADFDLRDLSVTGPVYRESMQWRQLKGDPAIRGLLFQQCRIESPIDRNIDAVMSVVEELLADRGVFHLDLHFSTGRAIIWLYDEPHVYRVLDVEDLVDPDICMTFQHREYPKDAMIPVDRIAAILAVMRDLRFADENIYLRSASINIINGYVSLHFSCDGSHYMPWVEFLEKDLLFWIGGEQPGAVCKIAV